MSLRENAKELLSRGELVAGLAKLRKLYQLESGQSTAGFIRKLKRQYPLSDSGLRLSILRSHTIEPILPLLEAQLYVEGMSLTTQLASFGAYAEEILDNKSSLYGFNPQVILLALDIDSLVPSLVVSGSNALVRQQLKAEVENLEKLIRHLRESISAPILISVVKTLHDKEISAVKEFSKQYAESLKDLTKRHSQLFLIDYAEESGTEYLSQANFEHSKFPFSAAGTVLFANDLCRYLLAFGGKLLKVIVTDLDNTVWEGVLGEDGIKGIKLGNDDIGKSFLDVQRTLLEFRDKGVLLAVSSKNNLHDVLEAFGKIPDMLLKPEHFSVLQVHWGDKTESIRAIAEELNVGLDSLCFIDDSPIERALVETLLPEVRVINLPLKTCDYAKVIADYPGLMRFRVTDEDLRRTAIYREEKLRRDFKASKENLEDFYRSLNLVASISKLSENSISRFAQLTQKTNQFNLTTKRFTESEVLKLLKQPNKCLFTMSVEDRFGDLGIVGAAIVTFREDNRAELELFLLSCRAIGRTVETALLSQIIECCKDRGCTLINGWFYSTAKNAPAQNFYEKHGFFLQSETEGGTLWGLNLNNSTVKVPEWITVV